VTVNYIIWSVIQPSHWILLTALVGVLAWKTRIGFLCRNVAVVLIVLFGLLPTASLLMRPLEARFDFPDELESVDGIIVLAGAEHRELTRLYGQPQLSSAGDRLTIFRMLAEAHPDARLVYSGSSGVEAATMLLEGSGIEAERLTMESASLNTCESAQLSKELLSPGSDQTWLLVTSAFHMPRAMACFRAADWDIRAYPVDFRTGSSVFNFSLIRNLRNLDQATHEWLGLVYYRARGLTDTLFPGPKEEPRAGSTS